MLVVEKNIEVGKLRRRR